MEKQERGILLADKEEAEQNIARIKKQLNGLAVIMERLIQSIIKNPEKVIFSNAPEGIGSIPMNLINTPSFDWKEIPKIEIMAQLIQDLRKEQSHLENIQRKLR